MQVAATIHASEDAYAQAPDDTPLSQNLKPPHPPADWKGPKVADWSPPDTRVLLARFHTNAFEPTCGTSLPRTSTTFLMPTKPANDMAVMMNRVELENRERGQLDGRWFVVVRTHAEGYCVLQVARDAGWIPQSEFDFPPGTTEYQFSNLAALQEAKRLNRMILCTGIDGAFHWAVAIRPLRPLWHAELTEVEMKGGAL